MYVVTFYSFKGGVGRTMAMINVATELAKRGRKILAVDFDLEAPGLTTYDFCGSTESQKGVVDYITDYQKTLIAPNVLDYVTECRFRSDKQSSEALSIWVMPAGQQGDSYKNRFHAINWESLYTESHGYLMMEDLKEQWRECIAPDYVFIDSRTGHTDVSGICTRQLPDAVVITFFPNHQNLWGLKGIVRDIRAEKDTIRKKSIQLHFVSSNIPDVDDEHGVLKKQMEIFRQELGYDEVIPIHYYNSVALVEQTIFTLYRPGTRLAKEYRELAGAIIKENPADRDGALSYLEDVEKRYVTRVYGQRSLSAPDFHARLDAIKAHFPNDGEVLKRLGDIMETQGKTSEALELYQSAMALDHHSARMRRSLADIYRQRGNTALALENLLSILNESDAEYFDVLYAIWGINELDAARMPEAITTPALRKLNVLERLTICDEFQKRRENLPLILRVFELEAVGEMAAEERTAIETTQSLALIGSGRFSEAMALLGPREALLQGESVRISTVFNYAMAEWAATRVAPKDLFGRVLDRDEASASRSKSANYAQCLAISCWVVGDMKKAEEWVMDAREMLGHARHVFSAWRYLNVRTEEFLMDLDEVLSMIGGSDARPEILAFEAHSTDASVRRLH